MPERVFFLAAASAVVVLLGTVLWRPTDVPESTGTVARLLRLQEPIRIEVLNGCGASQVAAHLTRKSRRLGFDVIREGNASRFDFLHTIVIDRRGDWGRARRAAEILGVPHCIQQIAETGYHLAEVSIVIGRDYERLGLLQD